MKFSIGQKVKIACNCGGITTYSRGVISEINNKGVFIDNGEGNDPTGPFDYKRGDLISLRGMGLGSQTIEHISKK